MSSSTCKPPSVHPPPSAKAIYDAATEEERERALKYAEWLVKNYCAPSNEALRELYRITLMQCAEQVFTAIAYELPRDHILLTMLDAQYQRKHKNTEECEESKGGEENRLSTSSAVIPIPATTSQVSMRTAWLRVGEVIKEYLNDNETSQYHCLLSDISVLRSQLEEHKDQVQEENRALREETDVQRMRMKEEGKRM